MLSLQNSSSVSMKTHSSSSSLGGASSSERARSPRGGGAVVSVGAKWRAIPDKDILEENLFSHKLLLLPLGGEDGGGTKDMILFSSFDR